MLKGLYTCDKANYYSKRYYPKSYCPVFLEKYLNLVKAELSNTVFVLFIQNASDQDIFYCKITSYRTTIFDISNYATFTRNMTDAIKLRIHFVIHTLLYWTTHFTFLYLFMTCLQNKLAPKA